MPIITIYQGASGSGQELAEAVAKTLGYRSGRLCKMAQTGTMVDNLNCCPGSRDPSCAQRGERCREFLPVYSRASATLP